jgi:ubiquinone/menaquinone biosynthesis C-methylase UbiE
MMLIKVKNLFDSPSMAAGYANARPAVHPHIIRRLQELLELKSPLPQALDVGCGAGLSTQALQAIARQCVGIDPSEAMIACARQLTPSASFLVGCAEALPVSTASTDLITAAGSLNYADLNRFFPEALRVLQPRGWLVVYDFSQGRSFRHSPKLDEWFARFLARYPMPPDPGRELSPEILGSMNSGFRLLKQAEFEVALEMSPESYLRYILTETNVAQAVSSGTGEEGVRAWCAATLEPVFGGKPQAVSFTGYLACLATDA